MLVEVKQIQNYLGDLNDAKVASQCLENFLKNWEYFRKEFTVNSPKKATAIRRYFRVKNTEQEQLLANFPEAWHQFNSIQLRQHLATAIASL